MGRIYEWLNRPLFGPVPVRQDARVDPALFPEDEFPVVCPKCAYELRGLPSPRCPECGELFDRGRLIVMQYVQDDAASWSRPRKTLDRIHGIVVLLLGALGITVWVVSRYMGRSPPIQRTGMLCGAVLIGIGLVYVCGLAKVVAAVIEFRRKRKLRQRVLDAVHTPIKGDDS